ncbi:MAG: winged helix-turn-helix transcriptional regulator [Phycisphaerae bacterium]|nr:winged helix-turn-helix transcriptional regulator [Phycisphaerae bacterium]
MSETTHPLLPMALLERAAETLRILAHPHRLRICELLLEERVPVKVLTEQLGIAGNAVSQHLNIMKAHGILGCEREGKTVFYRVIDPRPAWLLGCIRGHGQDQVDTASGRDGTAREK